MFNLKKVKAFHVVWLVDAGAKLPHNKMLPIAICNELYISGSELPEAVLLVLRIVRNALRIASGFIPASIIYDPVQR